MHTAYLASRIFASPSIQSETIFTHFTLRKLLTQFSHFVGVGRGTFLQRGYVCVPCFVKLFRVAREKKNCTTTNRLKMSEMKIYEADFYASHGK
jgi:hypothetical protein